MSKIQKTILGLSVLLYLVGGQFKLSHWTYGVEIQNIGLLILLLVFIPLFAIEKFKSKPTGRLFNYYISGLSAIVLLSAGDLLYNINSTTSLGLFLVGVGLLILIFIFLPLNIKLFKTSIFPDDRKKYRNRIIIISIYLVMLFLLLGLTYGYSMRLSKRFLEEKAIQFEERQKMEHLNDSLDYKN
jgi:hypothetical protein